MPLRQAFAAIGGRLLRRARASWPVCVTAALVLTSLVTYWRSRTFYRAEATVVLRVTEGQVATPGAQLGTGALRSYVADLVFTNANLRALLQRHAAYFPDLAQEEATVLEEFRREVTLAISENDFMEDRGSGDPPRSARMAITYQSPFPQLALAIARELGDLVIASTYGRQRQALERERTAAASAARRAEDEVDELLRDDPGGVDPRTKAARGRMYDARQRLETATLAVRALSEKQSLRFEVVDPGHLPQAVGSAGGLVAAVAVTLLGTSIAVVLLAGAFDPRVIDLGDLAAIRMRPLGQVPALPLSGGRGRGGRAGAARGRRSTQADQD